VAVMRAVGYHPLPPHARVRETEAEYIVELDVADFTAAELAVEALGPAVTVRGEQIETEADSGQPFRICERLEETFRLPDDVDLDTLEVLHKHGVLELHVTRTQLEPRRLRIRGGTALLINPDAEAV
jgi:HSP20 family molecular chaperone IbpA